MANERAVGAVPSDRSVGTESRLLGLPLVMSGALLLAVTARLWLAGEIETPWIFVDEIVYSDIAKSVASDGEVLVRDKPIELRSLLYPLLIAPAWLADSVGAAYAIAKALNVLLMTLAVVPTFLWGRRLVSPAWALTAAGLVLIMPSFFYTGVLMSENAFFPLFVAAMFAVAAMLERPTLGLQALALALVGLTVFARVQGLVLIGVLPLAILLFVVLGMRAPVAGESRTGRALAELRRFWATFAVLAGGTLAYALFQAAQGESLRSGLGAYEAVAAVDYSLGDSLHWIVLHFAELGFSVGVVPACAFLMLLGLALADGRTVSARERAFLAVTTSAVALVVVQVAVFASRFSGRIEERYMFPLAPLLFIALALWLSRGAPRRPYLVAAVAALVPALLVLKIELVELLGIQIMSDTFGLIPVLRASQIVDSVDQAQWLLRGGVALAAAAFLFVPRRFMLLLPLGVAAFLALSSYPVRGALRDYSVLLEGYAGGSDLDWLDDRVGRDVDVLYLYDAGKDPAYDPMIVWQTEFWNRSLGAVLRLGPPTRDPLPEVAGGVDPATGRIVGAPAGSTEYAVASREVQLAGRVVAARPRLALYRVAAPLRLAGSIEGLYGDRWMGASAALTRYAAPPSALLRITLSREAWGGRDVPGNVRVRVGPLAVVGGVPELGAVSARRNVVLHSGERRVVTLPAPRAPFRAEISITPTFSPADFGLPDTRELGAQVSFRVIRGRL